MSKFITFEGVDGSGKSTQIKLLAAHLKKQGHKVYLTKEPGGTLVGEQIRDVVHDTRNTSICPNTELLLYSASRSQLVSEVILPKLAEGYTVLCDRYTDSTYAYQGYGHWLNMNKIKSVTEFATQGLKPNLTIYLDLPAYVGLTRKNKANLAGDGELNRMDKLDIEFYRRVRAGYLTMVYYGSNSRWIVIDAQQSVNDIHSLVCKLVDSRINY